MSHPFVIAIDFDGTIVDSIFPAIIGLKKDSKKVINKLYDDGVQIVIWTCRTGFDLQNAENYLRKNEINFHHINENTPQRIQQYGGDTRKISADLYVDDKAYGCHINWSYIYRHVCFLRKLKNNQGEYVYL